VNVPFSTTDLRVGTGPEATPGRTVTVDYTGWLYDSGAADNKGTMFDSSLRPGRTPFVFTVGTGVIQGFSQGTIGMRVGGQRRVIIPPSLGYGSQGSGSTIPPNATLIFELELLAVQ
jgi:FKBP-type peptidyl-prolyl cis-trans isomerase